MKKLFFVLGFILINSVAFAKPLKIENSFGQLVRCGEWMNTQRAVVIRGCPELAVLFDSTPVPEPTPTPSLIPTPTPSLIPTPTPTNVQCEKRFRETAEGLMLETFYPPGQTVQTCAYMGPTDKQFVELNSINRSNAFCPVYTVDVISPSGRRYPTIEAQIQPGTILYPEVGTWQLNVLLVAGSECSKPYALQMLIRTK